MSSKHSSDNNPKGHEFLQNILSTRGQSSVKESSPSKADNTLNSKDDSAKIKSVLEVDKKIENPLAPNAPRDKEPAAEDEKVEVVDKSKIIRSEEHTSELQSRFDLVCRLLLEKKNRRDDDKIS